MYVEARNLGVIRIPVSLKCDTDTEFYNDFILDMKENRTLAGFIIDILRAYYEDDAVRDAVNKTVEIYNPYTEIRQRVQNIQMEHMKTMMATSMLSDHTQQSMEDVKDGSFMERAKQGMGGESDYQSQQDTLLLQTEQQQSQQTNQQENAFEQRIESIEKALPNISEQINLIMKLLQQNGAVNNQQPTHVDIPVSQATQETTYGSNVQYSQPTQQTDNTINQNYTPNIQQPINKSFVETKQPENHAQQQHVQPTPVVSVAPVTIEVEQPQQSTPVIVFGDEEEEAPKEKKPASFGKAFKSLKKG